MKNGVCMLRLRESGRGFNPTVNHCNNQNRFESQKGNALHMVGQSRDFTHGVPQEW